MSQKDQKKQAKSNKSGKTSYENKVGMLRKRKGFATAPNAIALGRNGLKPEEVGIWLHLEACPDCWKFSTERIAAAWEIGVRKTRRILQKLELFGLLERIPIHADGRFRGYEYILNYEIQSPPKQQDCTVPPKMKGYKTVNPNTEGQQSKGPDSLRSSGEKQKENSAEPSGLSSARGSPASPSTSPDPGEGDPPPNPHPDSFSSPSGKKEVGEGSGQKEEDAGEESESAREWKPSPENNGTLAGNTEAPPGGSGAAAERPPVDPFDHPPEDDPDEISDEEAHAELERRLGPSGQYRRGRAEKPPGMSHAEHARQLRRQRATSGAT